jgi:hypothetical protein
MRQTTHSEEFGLLAHYGPVQFRPFQGSRFFRQIVASAFMKTAYGIVARKSGYPDLNQARTIIEVYI